jgi:hypothetical protein
VEGSAPSETKEETAYRVEALNVGVLTTLGTFDRTNRRKMMMMMMMMMVNLDQLASYEGIAWDEWS